MTRGNIIGEDLKDYLVDEIKTRQQIHGSGFNIDRTPQQVQFLSNRNSWIKMGSSVFVNDSSKLINPKFEALGNKAGGDKLAINNGYLGVIHDLKTDKEEPNKTSWNLYNEFGVDGDGGREKYGFVPPPGIESFNLKTLNRGSIRKGEIKMKAFSKAQFDVIDFLYFRPGFSIMVEWGWDKHMDGDNIKEAERKTILDNFWWNSDGADVTHLDMQQKIEALRATYKGNYDGFFGKVANFEWSLGVNGIYDITLSLISMGDVIESLNINQAPAYSFTSKNPTNSEEPITTDDVEKHEKQSALKYRGGNMFKADANIVKGSESNKLCQILYNSIADENFITNSPYYYSLKDSIDNRYLNKAIDNRYNYYITFGELMFLVEKHLISSITNEPENPKKSEKMVSMDNFAVSDRKEYQLYIPVFPNQISLDPRVCIFEHRENIGYNKIVEKGLSYVNLGICFESDKGVNKNLKFIEQITVNGKIIRVGKLKNLFINFDFIAKCLLEGTNEKGEMNLFSFLKSICDGINKALGNVNQIEPVLKDDKVITFIDKSPIPGTKIFRRNTGITDTQDYNINLWGYNTDEGITSNFVKDFTFKTKITPQMSHQISIGATAAGSYTSVINGTTFENWNAGLKDKFNQYSINPSPYVINESEESKELKLLERILKGYDKMESADAYWERNIKNLESKGITGSDPLWIAKIRGYNKDNIVVKDKDGKDIILNREEQKNRIKKRIYENINSVIEEWKSQNYGSYLMEAFNDDANSNINVSDVLEEMNINISEESLKILAQQQDIDKLEKNIRVFNSFKKELEDTEENIFGREMKTLYNNLYNKAIISNQELINRGQKGQDIPYSIGGLSNFKWFQDDPNETELPDSKRIYNNYKKYDKQ